MEFGVCFKGGPSPKRLRCLAQQLDAGDFDHCWFYDSHILWRDCYVAMATCIEHTGRLRLGACVTNQPWGFGSGRSRQVYLPRWHCRARAVLTLVWDGESVLFAGWVNDRPISGRWSMVEFGQQVKAMMGNHIAAIVERCGADSNALPKSLSAYVKNRRGYDYSEHG